MKSKLISLLFFTTLQYAVSRDLLPERWFENVAAADGSIQQSLVFRTAPGVLYRVETSEDLNAWTAEAEFYGLGHEIVVPMREFTPPPPPPPGSNPPLSLPPPPSASPSLHLRRSSSVEGGTLVSWRSLDHGGPMIAGLEEELVEGWSNVPLYSNRHGAYQFFIWHTRDFAAPPSQPPLLGIRDAAMLAQLVASLLQMNEMVANSAALARSAPPPAPPQPGGKKFWRIHADWGIDTDGDGSFDWAEFEIAGNLLHPSNQLANPFSFDHNQECPASPSGKGRVG